jgi:diguanylate cyclase (GGDEF)-like protein
MKNPFAELMKSAQWRRALPGIGSVALIALVLVLAATLGMVDAAVAVDGCLAFALLASVVHALARSGYSARYPEANVITAQLFAAFLLLAWLTFRSEAAASVTSVPYLVAMLYGMLQLDRARLAILASFALITHGTALFMLIDHGYPIELASAGTQFGALLLALAWFTYIAGVVLRLRERLAEAHRKLHDLGLEADDRASRDSLTGAYNHRHLMDALEREIARAERVGKPLSIARIDLDWLGSVNEAHGTAAGDVALKLFTAAAADALRDVDIFGRYGGKEFLALMPDTDLRGAVVAAERIRARVGRQPLPEVRGRRHLSCTLGVAEHRKGENSRLVIGRAEASLIYAKATGRDRVVALDADGRPAVLEKH